MVKNMREFIKKHENVKILLFLIFPVIVFSAFLTIMPGDEMYNFQSISKMVNGNIIYKDFNVIITPLFFWVGTLFCKIFGNYILSLRIYSVLIHFGLYYAFYYLLKKLDVSLKMRTNGLLAFMLLSVSFVFNGANYNPFAILFYIIGLIVIIDKPSTKNSIIIGILAYLVFMIKQNLGGYFVVAVVLAQIINYKKECIKPLIIEFITGAFLTGITVLIMSLQGNFVDMLNYTFFNLGSFAGDNFMVQKGKLTPIIIIGMITICVEVLFFVYTTKYKTKKNICVFIFATMLIPAILPIINMYHLEMSIVLVVAEYAILFDKLLQNNMTQEDYEALLKKYKLMSIDTLINLLDGVFYVVLLSTIIMHFATYEKLTFVTEENVYKNTFVEEETMQNIESIADFIKAEKENGNNVIILSDKAALYMTYLGINNGDMDLPFNGNLGKDGLEGLIKKIEAVPNKIILIDKIDPFWQIPEELRDYVLRHYRKIDKMGDFYIFEKLNIPIDVLEGNSQ